MPGVCAVVEVKSVRPATAPNDLYARRPCTRLDRDADHSCQAQVTSGHIAAEHTDMYPSPEEAAVIDAAHKLMVSTMSRYDPSHDAYHGQ